MRDDRRDDRGSSRPGASGPRTPHTRSLPLATDPRVAATSRHEDQQYGVEAPPPASPPRVTLPSIPALPTVKNTLAATGRHRAASPRSVLSRVTQRRPRRASTWGEYAAHEAGWSGDWSDDWPDADSYEPDRKRANTAARPLSLIRVSDAERYEPDVPHVLPPESIPDLVAYRPPRLAPRPANYTRAIIRGASNTARSPWSLARAVLVTIAVVLAVWVSLTGAGEPSQPLMNRFQANVGSTRVDPVTARVKPLTQMRRVDQYDSRAQFDLWGGAACSAAVTAELFTAWGVPNITIGRMIREMGPYISPNGGLLDYEGYRRVARLHGFTTEFREDLTYEQILYIANTLGLPLVVNIRISYGYYRFFAGGHFVVVTAGDSRGLRIVDSSLYYITYLPKDVFYSMFTGRTMLFVPQGYQYSVPN